MTIDFMEDKKNENNKKLEIRLGQSTAKIPGDSIRQVT